MATEVIPWPVVAEKSDAEESLAQAFRDSNLGPEWLIFHSLNLADGSTRKKWCEADFLVLGPPGMLVIEVKGGGVSRRAGRWYSINQSRVEHAIQDPVEQARIVAFGMADALSLVFPSLQGRLATTLIGFGVAFPDCSWRTTLAELPEQLVIDAGTCKPDVIPAYLKAAFAYWQRKLGNRVSTLAAEDRLAIRTILRPDFDLFASQAIVGDRLISQQARATDEQYAALDFIRGTPRACFEGGAGTGKTFVACEACRRLSAEGLRVALVVHSRPLCRMLRTVLGQMSVTILLASELSHCDETFDALVVDEGQDLLQPESFAAVDRVLEGGMRAGRWFWFMDSNRQLLPGTRVSEECLDRVLKLGGHGGRPFQLHRNCRNAPKVRDNAVVCTGYDVGTCLQAGGGGDAEAVSVASVDEAFKALTEWVDVLTRDGVRMREIAILTNGHPAWLAARLKAGRCKFVCLDEDPALDVRTHEGMCISSIEAFKGLERPHVAFMAPAQQDADIDDRSLYVALTRARVSVRMILCPALWTRLERSAAAVADQHPSMFGA